MTPQIQLIVLYTQRIVQLPKLRITYYLNKCLDPLDCTVLGPSLEFCITYYLDKCLIREELYSIENVSGTLCSMYECLLGVEFLNNGF